MGKSVFLDDALGQVKNSGLYHYTDYGRYIAIICPFHADNTPSCLVYKDRYKCTACGANGWTSELLQPDRKVNYNIGSVHIHEVDEKERIKSPFPRWEYQFGNLRNTLKTAYRNNSKNFPLNSKYLIDRGISLESLEKCKIGRLDHWFTFPIWHRDGSLAGAVARYNGKSTLRYVIPFNQDPNLLYIPNWDLIKEKKVIFVVFGIIDAVSVAQCGYASITTTSGKRVRPEWFHEFRKILIFIPDKKEELEAKLALTGLDWRGKMAVPDYQENEKDCNDLLSHNKLHSFLERTEKLWL